MGKLSVVLLLGLLLIVPAHTTRAQEPQPGFAISSPTPGETVPQRTIAVRGTGVPGAKAVWDRGRLLSDVAVAVDAAGRWSMQVTLREGSNEFVFRQENPDAGPVPLTVMYEPAPDAPDASDTRIGIGPFSIDLSDWVLKFVYGAWSAAGGGEIQGLGNQIAGIMLTNPDPTVAGGGMQSVQNVVDYLIAFSLSLLTVMFVFSVWRFSYGQGGQPVSALYRLAGAIFLLGFYRYLFRYVVGASNAATYAILGGPTIEQASLTQVLTHIAPTSPLWAIVSLVALVFVLLLGFLRVMGFVYILVLYALGPLVIPLMMDKSTAQYFDFWWRSLVRVLAWSIVWAVEFKLFDAVTAMGATGGVVDAVFAPLAAMALIFVMFKTPKLLPGPTPMQGLEMVSRQVSGHVSAKVLSSTAVKAAGASVAAAPAAVAYGAARVVRGAAGAVRGSAGSGRRSP